MLTTSQLLALALSAPKTHRCVTAFADGRTRIMDTASLAQANNHAVIERRKIGRKLIDRVSGDTVCVVSVDVIELPKE